jgi:excinuclease ABC subunit C
MWIDAPVDLATLPREPGVYRMLDAKRKVLYVGKARNLRKRVSSYFQRKPESPRIQAMVMQVCDLEVSITPSEADALILEHNLIKQLKPRYNVLLKDSKSYPYILLTGGDYPRLRLYRGDRLKSGGECFGPFPNAAAVHETLHVMQSVFKIRDCEDSVFNNRSRPCMQFQIGRCSGPCCDIVSREEYARQVEEVRAFLRGRDDELLKGWETEMQAAASRHAFEKAAMLRDRIRALRTILAGSEGSDLPHDADAIVILRQPESVAACIGVRRAGRNLGTHTVRIQQAVDADDIEILQSLLIERYRQEPPPAELLISVSDDDTSELQQIVKLLHPKVRTRIRSPKRGPLMQWLTQVRHSGEQHQASRGGTDQQQAFEALAELLELDQTPQLLAAVDNAHLGGKQTVAAIVYGGWGGPEKDYYRRYKLDDVPEGDDYAAMEAVLTRFFRAIVDESLPCPDIMLIDGGRGQLAIAREAATVAGLHTLRLVGVAKGNSRKLGEENLWRAWLVGSAPLKPGRHHPGLLLVARVRDEAHRFAGEYMRKRKKQSMFTSQLDTIPGIGKAKRADLLRFFGGIEGVKKASRKQLCEVPGVSDKLAGLIFESLHK